MSFKELKLHDATLKVIEINWEFKTVLLTGRTCGKDSAEFTLEFEGVSYSEIPHTENWGPSSSIHEQSSPKDGEYHVLMQSGDTILIKAKSYEYEKTI
ncbi:MAG: outer membrane PBP1 activator LpoA protein [Cellvibrionaceae bacterium]|jgi:outer membrane PBP1 activator LpoA protein